MPDPQPDPTPEPAPEPTPDPAPDPAPDPTPDPEAQPITAADTEADAYARAMAAIEMDEEEEEGEAAEDSETAPVSESASEPDPGTEASGDAQPEPTAPEPPKPRESDRWAKLTAEEQRIRHNRDEVKAERVKMEAERAQWAKERDSIQKIRDGKGLEGLSELGLSYNEMTAQILAGKNGADLEPLRKEVEDRFAKMQSEIEAANTRATEAEQGRAAADQGARTVAHIRGTLVDADSPDRWGLLQDEPNWETEVYQTIKIDWERAGSPKDAAGQPIPTLTAAEAGDRLEKFLVDRDLRRSGHRKIKALIATSPDQTELAQRASESTQGNEPAPSKPVSPTLTNSHSGQVARAESTADPDACRSRALSVLEQYSEE